MIDRILLYFGMALAPLDLVARALAANIVQTHDLYTLDEAGTVRELQRRYASIAIETGLPMGAQRQVATMAWRYIAQARDEKPRGGDKYLRLYV